MSLQAAVLASAGPGSAATLARRRAGRRLEPDTSRLVFDMAQVTGHVMTYKDDYLDMLQLKRRLADSFMYHGTKRDLELECVTTLSFGRSYDSILEQVRSSSLHCIG